MNRRQRHITLAAELLTEGVAPNADRAWQIAGEILKRTHESYPASLTVHGEQWNEVLQRMAGEEDETW